MIRSLYTKHKDKILYLFFGVLTTVVNWVVYAFACQWGWIPEGIRATVSNIIAWAAAVVFAFVTNKPFVFRSHDWSGAVMFPEFARFVLCRISSGLIETGIIFVAVDLLHGNSVLFKVLTSVFVVVFNYFASKFLVFGKKSENNT